MKKLIILDRDGVINFDSPNYIRSAAEFEPIPGSLEAIARLCKAGFHVAVATNQSGIGRGYFDTDTLQAIHDKARRLVAARGGHLAHIAHCPHLPTSGCDCRKPGTGLISAIEAALKIPAAGACFVGDGVGDVEAARRYGCRPLLVLTGKGAATARQLGDAAPPRFKDLAAATDRVLAEESS